MKAKNKVLELFNNAQIISALTWAAVMISSSLVLQGANGAGDLFNILLAGATVHMLLLSKMARHSNKTGEKKPKLA